MTLNALTLKDSIAHHMRDYITGRAGADTTHAALMAVYRRARMDRRKDVTARHLAELLVELKASAASIDEAAEGFQMEVLAER